MESIVARELMKTMETNWAEPEPYNESLAIEVAMNELLDYAVSIGCTVEHDSEEIDTFSGLTVHKVGEPERLF